MAGKIASSSTLPTLDPQSPPSAGPPQHLTKHPRSPPSADRCGACRDLLLNSSSKVEELLEESFVRVPGYLYPNVLIRDRAEPELDCISLAIADDDGRSIQSTSDLSKERSSPLKMFELLLTFVAVVCLWGSIDDIVEVIADGDSHWGITVYLAFAIVAILIQMVCNKIFRTDMSVARGIEMF